MTDQLKEAPTPIDLLLFCPGCGVQHVDEARPDVCETCGQSQAQCCCETFTPWLNPAHKSHRCEACNYVWRPADVPTNGIRENKTKGQRDYDPAPQWKRQLQNAGVKMSELWAEKHAAEKRGQQATARVAVIEKALKVYANESMWVQYERDGETTASIFIAGEDGQECGVLSDGYLLAQAALKGKEGDGK